MVVLVMLFSLIIYMKFDFEQKLNDFKSDLIFSIDKRLVKIETIMSLEKPFQTKKGK